LQDLTQRSAEQTEALLAYYGLPEELPPSRTTEQLLSAQNQALTEAARRAARQRPDPWDVADYLLKFGIALAGVVGGAYGAKAAAALQAARAKSTALREIVRGNEIFKRRNPAYAQDFKQAQAGQSPTTRQLVAQMK